MKRRGFTLVEILIVLSIIAILTAILLPAFNRSRSTARTVSCASNLRQLGLAFRAYAQDNGGFYPNPSHYGSGLTCSWPERVIRYVRSPQILVCPEAPGIIYRPGCGIGISEEDAPATSLAGYDMNEMLIDDTGQFHEVRLRAPSSTVLALDGTGIGMRVGNVKSTADILSTGLPLRHSNGAVVLFGDGHAKRLSLEALAQPGQWTLKPND